MQVGRAQGVVAGDQQGGAALPRVEVRRRAVQARQHAAGVAGMAELAQRRPRGGVAVEIQAAGRCMDFVHPLAGGDRGHAGRIGQHPRNRDVVAAQVLEQGVFLAQRRRRAHALVLALDEDLAGRRAHPRHR